MPCLGIIRSSGLAFLSLGTRVRPVSFVQYACICLYYAYYAHALFFSFLQTGRTGYSIQLASPLITVAKLGLSPRTGASSSTERKKWSANCIDMSIPDYDYIYVDYCYSTLIFDKKRRMASACGCRRHGATDSPLHFQFTNQHPSCTSIQIRIFSLLRWFSRQRGATARSFHLS